MSRAGIVVALAFAAMPSVASAASMVTSGSVTATVHVNPWHIEYNAVDEASRALAFTSGG